MVPARDEQALLPDCLVALDAAAARVPIPTTVVVVLDTCTDDSARVVAETKLHRVQRLIVVLSDQGRVGYARHLGVSTLLAEYGSSRLWLASTDADSTVPGDWFARQLRHHAQGASAVLGTVRVADWAGHSLQTRLHYQQGYRALDGHRHTHGANISMTATAYLAAGGFPQVATDEDVGLTQRLIASGQSIAWAADLPVITSSRLAARAPAGFASHLRLLSAAAGGDVPVGPDPVAGFCQPEEAVS